MAVRLVMSVVEIKLTFTKRYNKKGEFIIYDRMIKYEFVGKFEIEVEE